ncbi:glycerol 3-phosphate acyltransferase [Peptoniphilus sp. ING2-D1G]|nr:glycerol 3-phosphate acyltransferase [Peptoniphilus sp. ING2-D1G]
MKLIFSLLFSYLIGSISGSYLIGIIFLKKDIRNFGSGNAGTTNAMRTFGKKWGVLTFIIDFFKGLVLMVIIKKFFLLKEYQLLICALFCILGHDFPFHMKFKGGKGVATTLGTMAVYDFYTALISVAIWILVVIVSKIVSLGSIFFFISLLLFALIFNTYADLEYTILIMITSLGIFRHNSNIYRLLNGNENKIGDKKK